MLAVSQPRFSLSTLQLIRKAVLLAVIIGGVFLVTSANSLWTDGGLVHESIEATGLLLIAICIAGRTMCALYIGGLKNKSLIDKGPYSVTRNPLYLFSVIGAIGVGAQLGSAIIALLAGVVTWAIFYVLIFSEERAMKHRFGATYRNYASRVPRFFPKMSLWHDVNELTIRPGIVRSTFVDACIFLVSIPIAEAFDYLHTAGIVPVLFRVP